MSEEPGEEHQQRGSRRDLLTFLLAAVVFVALVVLATLLGLHDRHHSSSAAPASASREQAVLAAARAESVALTSIGYQTANHDLDRILAGATGTLKTRFAAERAQLPGTLRAQKSVSKGTALSSGLAYLRGNTAQALVAVDANVTGTGIGQTGVQKHYRMVITMQEVAGHWLANDVAFAGTPQ